LACIYSGGCHTSQKFRTGEASNGLQGRLAVLPSVHGLAGGRIQLNRITQFAQLSDRANVGTSTAPVVRSPQWPSVACSRRTHRDETSGDTAASDWRYGNPLQGRRSAATELAFNFRFLDRYDGNRA